MLCESYHLYSIYEIATSLPLTVLNKMRPEDIALGHVLFEEQSKSAEGHLLMDIDH